MRRMAFIGLIVLLFDCSKNDFKPSSEESCRIGRYTFRQTNGADESYNITYVENSLTRPSVISDEVLFGDTWAPASVYKHLYIEDDSLYIKDFRQFHEGDTYLTALLSGTSDKIQTVITNFPDNNGTYRYTFDYSKDDQVTVTLEKLDGLNATFDSRGIYKITNDDVVSLDITRNPALHNSDPDNFTSRNKTFTYDIVDNPIKGLVLVHFIKPELPDVRFFSAHNRTSETYDNITRTYKLEYGTDPMPKQMTTPEGVIEKYDYPNCSN